MCEKCEITRSILILVLGAAGADTASRGDPQDFMQWAGDNTTMATICQAAQIPVEVAAEEWQKGYRSYTLVQTLRELLVKVSESDDNDNEQKQPAVNSPLGSA